MRKSSTPAEGKTHATINRELGHPDDAPTGAVTVLAFGLALAGMAWSVRPGAGLLPAHPRMAPLRVWRPGAVGPVRRRLRFAAALLLLLLGVALSIPACGGGGGVVSHAGTPAGTYTLTVTATATSGTASLTHKTTLTLTVQ